jgi:hypothetical protein
MHISAIEMYKPESINAFLPFYVYIIISWMSCIRVRNYLILSHEFLKLFINSSW